MNNTTPIALLMMAITSAVGLFYAIQKRDQAILEQPLMPVRFEHHIHKKTDCLLCHHDYIGDTEPAPTGARTCYACHKDTPELARTMEKDFHQLCRQCHIQQTRRHQDSGPLRLCSDCHELY